MEREQRWPIAFVFEGKRATLTQPFDFTAIPLRLVVSEPTLDAVLELRFGGASFVFRGWPIHQRTHGRELQDARLIGWSPGALASLDVVQGSIAAAAFICKGTPELDLGGAA